MRVSLAQPRHPHELQARPSELAAAMLANPLGPRVVLGGEAGGSTPIVPSAHALFGARAAVLASRAGPLVVADTGHHRVLIWHRAPEIDGAPADVVFASRRFRAKAETPAAPSPKRRATSPSASPCETACSPSPIRGIIASSCGARSPSATTRRPI